MYAKGLLTLHLEVLFHFHGSTSTIIFFSVMAHMILGYSVSEKESLVAMLPLQRMRKVEEELEEWDVTWLTVLELAVPLCPRSL